MRTQTFILSVMQLRSRLLRLSSQTAFCPGWKCRRSGDKSGDSWCCRFSRGTANCWCESGDSNPHGFPRQILSLNPGTDSKADQSAVSAESGKVLQNPQPPGNKGEGLSEDTKSHDRENEEKHRA